jgi:hypothetical protein
MSKISRRKIFISGASLGAMTLIGGVGSLTAKAEGFGSDLTQSDGPQSLIRVNVEIDNNHGHELLLTRASLSVAEPVVLSIKGGSSHEHTVKLTPADCENLKSGNAVTLVSSTGVFHTHSVKLIPVLNIDGQVSENHGHAVSLSGNAFEVKLDIVGESSHSHTIVLSLEDLITIRDGQPLTVQSSEEFGHAHEVVFNS